MSDINQIKNELENCLKGSDSSYSLPPTCYTNDNILQIEKNIFFKNHWICIGHINFLKNPGDYFTKEVSDIPIIIIKDKSNKIRIFSNSCRHRSARLLDGEGNVNGIICPFHSWAYKLDGSLAGAPNMNETKDFKKCDYGLKEFRAEERAGFGFLCFDENQSNLDKQIDNFVDIHSQWPMDTLVSTRKRSFKVKCNWKAFLEVFNEYYHLPFVHPETIGDVYQLPEAPDFTKGSFTSQFGKTSGTGALLESEQMYALPKMKGIKKNVINSARYTWLFPNLTFAVGDDALWIYEVHPIDTENCNVIQTTCFPESTIKLDTFDKLSKQYYHRMDAAIEEDIPALENQQAGLRSPYATQGRFSPLLEANVAAFARYYAETLINKTNSI